MTLEALAIGLGIWLLGSLPVGLLVGRAIAYARRRELTRSNTDRRAASWRSL